MSRRAKRVLAEAVAHVGPEVIVISPGVNGHGYLATSMPTRTEKELEDLIVMTNEALKRLRSWQRRRRRENSSAEVAKAS